MPPTTLNSEEPKILTRHLLRVSLYCFSDSQDPPSDTHKVALG